MDGGDGVSDLLKASLRRLSVRHSDDDGDCGLEKVKPGRDASLLDLSHLGWISDLVDD